MRQGSAQLGVRNICPDPTLTAEAGHSLCFIRKKLGRCQTTSAHARSNTAYLRNWARFAHLISLVKCNEAVNLTRFRGTELFLLPPFGCGIRRECKEIARKGSIPRWITTNHFNTTLPYLRTYSSPYNKGDTKRSSRFRAGNCCARARNFFPRLVAPRSQVFSGEPSFTLKP